MIDRLKAIAADPFAKHANVDSFVGEKDAFRFRQGDWRAVYKVDREAGVMRVLRIEPRGEVYR
jgi:mRNA interferase RelE/StbE